VGLKIVAMPAGYIRNAHGPASTYLRNWDRIYDAPMIMFAVVGGEHPVLVDTGTPAPEVVHQHHSYNFTRSEDEAPLVQLERAGIDPEDVRTVVFTHLHWDHCGNSELFPNARFVVQARELAYAMDPLPPNRAAYERTATANPPWLGVLGRIQTVDGAVEVEPGISTVPLPGHTPGSQGVLVETDAGRFLIAGDCIGLYENWTGDGTLAHIPSGSFTNLHEYMDSFARIEQLGCEVIPSHDPKVLETGVFG
jgi:glyoxylase-like metal-dependent hydrolase (beta-lactamase superfamily II)